MHNYCYRFNRNRYKNRKLYTRQIIHISKDLMKLYTILSDFVCNTEYDEIAK